MAVQNGTSQSRMAELAQVIASETAKIEAYFKENALAPLSLDSQAPQDFPVPSSNLEIHNARKAVINASRELQMLVTGPRDNVRWDALRYLDLLSLQFVNNYRVAHIVPVEGEMTFAAIAAETGASEDLVTRFVRHAMTDHIFCEPRLGYVAHTAASMVLREDQSISDWIWLQTEEAGPMAMHTLDILKQFPGSEEPDESVYSTWKGVKEPMYKIMAVDPEKAARFGRTMAGFSNSSEFEFSTLVEGYDWAALGEGTVVDVGGSTGFVSAAIAERFTRLKFVVEDLAPMLKNGPLQTPKQLLHRIQFQPHDFFTPQPVRGASVYLLRWITHNWSDKYFRMILENLVPALEPGSRILVNDICLSESVSTDTFNEKIARNMDILMLQCINARERALEDFRKIFAQVDERFEFVQCRRPKNSCMSIIEFKWK